MRSTRRLTMKNSPMRTRRYARLSAYDFPSISEFGTNLLDAYWGRTEWIVVFPLYAELVYDSVAKIFYTKCTDSDRETAQAIGHELNDKGGIALMLCVHYATLMVGRDATIKADKESWLATTFTLNHIFHNIQLGQFDCNKPMLQPNVKFPSL